MRATSRLQAALLAAGLVASLLLGNSPVQALSVREIPAGWVDTYAATGVAAKAAAASNPTIKRVVAQNSQNSQGSQGFQGSQTSKRATAQSVINVSYTDVPVAEQSAVQAAITVWSQNWQSIVPVNVNARYISEGVGGILASASPVNFFQGFPGAPDATIWYPSAMANALSGKDLDPNNPEIQININSTMASSFYLGTDGNCPSNQYDLESIIIHEMTHGLGFLSNDSFDPFLGYGTIDQPTPFDAFAQTPDGSRLMDLPSPSTALGQALQNTLVWSGVNGVAANNGVKPILYTPNPYQAGSSVSHLDQNTFQNSGANALMTPSWPAGAVFHSPGPLAVAMLQDMRSKPPAGKPAGVPNSPRNVSALVGDKSAIVAFTAPDNARTSIVSNYTIKVDQTGQVITATASPVTISHLTNGTKYSFTVTASNPLGSSQPATSNVVTPQPSWGSTTIDPAADAKYLATTTFRGQPVIAYSDSKSGDLKLASWNGKSWQLSTVDGNSSIGGRTKNDVSGNISLCTSAAGPKQRLDIFYGDLTSKWLRYAGFDGKKWSYSVVDGNGVKINAYTDPNRVRSSSDVSGSSACVDTVDGLQVFYRDQSQGIVLGATATTGIGSSNIPWSYELVDGDRATNGRTTGDVGFHIAATNLGREIYLLYDSVLQVNQQKSAIEGEVRLATRSSAYPEDWSYQSLDAAGGAIAVAGYGVALSAVKNSVKASWLASNALTLPNPNVLRYVDLTHNGTVSGSNPALFGVPQSPIATNGQKILFNCQNRLCAFNSTTQLTSLVSSSDLSQSQATSWVVINKVNYALAGVNGQLVMFKES